MNLDFITRDNFIAWLKTKPADEEYDYCEPRKCPFAQFLKANGVEKPSCNPYEWWEDRSQVRSEPSGKVPEWFHEPARMVRRDTFGNLLQRIESYQEEKETPA